MPFNGSGVFERLYSWVTDRDAGTKILADRHDAEDDGIVAGLNDVVDGTQGFIGPVKGTNGTAASPAFSFTDDTDSGAYRVSADVLGFAVSGTLEMKVEAGYVDAVNGLKIGGTAVTSTAAELNILDGVTATATELNILDGVTATATELNALDGVTATATELNALDGITATVTELNYTDGVTSNIQTQIDAKQGLDATLTALAGLSTGASKIPYSTGTDTFGQLDFVDEDDMISDSATAIPSQQSVKAYVDSSVTAGTVDTSGTPVANDIARFTDANTVEGRSYAELKADLDLEIGTDVLAYSADLQTFLDSNTLPNGNGTDGQVLTSDGAGGTAWESVAGGGVDTSGTPVANDFARFTDADTIEGRSYSEARSDLSLAHASASEIRSGTANRAITPDGIESACEPVTISGTSNWTPDWSSFITADWEVTWNRTINNPTNVEPGMTRQVRISGSTTTDRTITWGANFVGNVPDGFVDSTTYWLVTMTASLSTSEIWVSFVEEAP